jgi:hypothetical protein
MLGQIQETVAVVKDMEQGSLSIFVVVDHEDGAVWLFQGTGSEEERKDCILVRPDLISKLIDALRAAEATLPLP